MIFDQVTVATPATDLAPTPALADAFPRVIVDAERAVYEYVLAATAQGLSFYADRARALAEGKTIPVVIGWPAYPGQVPAIGVAAGTETEDQQSEVMQGGYVGEARVFDETDPTKLVGVADYYSEPLYSPITVELIHENRDERDRLHNELRMLLLPIETALLERTPLIKRVRVDAEKTEAANGPMSEELPMVVYLSLFTIHVYCELLVPRDIAGPDGVVGKIDVSVPGADTGP